MNLISTLVICQQSTSSCSLNSHIEECEDVKDLLQIILKDEGSVLKQNYAALNAAFAFMERKKGPKSFQRFVNQIFEFIKTYSYDRLRTNKEQIVILNLTYYQKTSMQLLTFNQKLQILIIYITANIHAYLRTRQIKKLNSVGDKLQQITNLKVQGYLQNILYLLIAIYAYLKCEFKKAKTLFANLFTKIVTQNRKDLKNGENMQIMAICAFYSYLNLLQLDEKQLSFYYLTKAHEYGKELGQQSKVFLSKIKQIGSYKAYRVVKLTRIQNNLQALNRRTKSSWNSKTFKCKIYNQKKHIDLDILKQELKNIFTIKDTKATMYKFRKDNLKYLNKEQSKLQADINNREEELHKIKNMRIQLSIPHQLIRVQEQIKKIQYQKNKIKNNYLNMKENNLHKLKPVKVIQNYFKSYISAIKFTKHRNMYQFLYGQMISRTKLFILSWFIKRKTQSMKKNVKYQKIYYKGLLHFIQLYQIVQTCQSQLFLYKKKQAGYYIKIYPLQKNKAEKNMKSVVDQLQINHQTFLKLKQVPFYYQYQEYNGKLVHWNHIMLSSNNLKIVYYVRKFVQLMNRNCKNLKKFKKSQKIHVLLQFEGETSIQITLFAFITKINPTLIFNSQTPNQQKYVAQVFTIGGPKYKNKLYNLKFIKNIQIEQNFLTIDKSNQLVKNQLMNIFEKNVESIKRIQRFIKLFQSKKQFAKLKKKTCISVFVQGYDIISYCKHSMGKSFLVAENIFTKERQCVQTMMDPKSFNQIKIIKDKLAKEKTCSQKIKIACRFIWTKFFVSKLKYHYRGASILTDFQLSFRNRIIFAKAFPNFLYNKQVQSGKIMFTLMVESLLQFPRPYLFRIFSLSKDCTIIDITYKIFHREKVYYQHNINSLNRIVNITSATEFQLLKQMIQNNEERLLWNGRPSRNSRSSRNSIRRSIISITNQDEIKQLAGASQIVPKFSSKKNSMLVRFKNRKSHEVSPSINIKRVQRSTQNHTIVNYELSPSKKSEGGSITSNSSKS